MSEFLGVRPSAADRWRALVLLGRNTASYKFALAQALLELDRSPGDLLTLQELALPFATSLCAHLSEAPKQGATGINRALREACEGYNAGHVSKDALRAATVRHGFGDVIDAFHVLGGSPLENPFFVDERREAKGIRLTDQMRALAELKEHDDLMAEVDGRWRVVETGWELGVNAGLVEYDRESGKLSVGTGDRRLSLRSCRSTLNGYQRGRCFYCFAPISVAPGPLAADVDHFFPWALRGELPLIDGIWNLVLACQSCNRGPRGKFDSAPALPLLERLHRRNEYYVDSKHRLAVTITAQTGRTPAARSSYLQSAYDVAAISRIRHWSPEQRSRAEF
jgi:5-methylcytosine-specific restriction endonuclease McrA